jgi:hypothetical protein
MNGYTGPGDWVESLLSLAKKVDDRWPESSEPVGPPPRHIRPESSKVSPNRRILLAGAIALVLHRGRLGFGHDDPAIEKTAKGFHDRARELAEKFRIQSGPVVAEFSEAARYVQQHLAFFTDFTERDPLRFWHPQLARGLTIEPFEDRMSALPAGLSLLKPSAGMTDGRTLFHFMADGREAQFMLRGQDHRNGYLVQLRRRREGEATVVDLSVRKLRGGRWKRILTTTARAPIVTRLSGQRVSIEMEGNSFAARLHWEQERFLPGLPPALNETVVASWRDTSFRDGAVGLWGPNQPAARSGREFRVFSVKVNT